MMQYQSNLSASISIAHPDKRGKDGDTPPEESNSNPTNVIVMDIPAGLDHVHILSRCACALLETISNLEEREANLYNLELAIQEVSVNIVKHAYAQMNGRIRMCLTLEDQPLRMVISLYDTGKSFDPAQIPAPKLGELQEHGFGLFLVRELMDEVEYNHSPTGNMWKLIKNIPLTMPSGR